MSLSATATRRRLRARLIRKPQCGLVLNAQFEHDGPLIFEHACKLGCEGIVSKRLGSRYRSGHSREAEEDWGKGRWR